MIDYDFLHRIKAVALYVLPIICNKVQINGVYCKHIYNG